MMSQYIFLFLLTINCPPISTLFPYTTLFRSHYLFARAYSREDRQTDSSVIPIHVNTTNDISPWESMDIGDTGIEGQDRKSTRLNSSHVAISYAVFCLKKKKKQSIHKQKITQH